MKSCEFKWEFVLDALDCEHVNIFSKFKLIFVLSILNVDLQKAGPIGNFHNKSQYMKFLYYTSFSFIIRTTCDYCGLVV